MKGKANVPGASGLDMARIQKVASDAASVAAEAKKTAESASTAAGTAQKAADKALEAISKLAFTIDAVPTQSGILSYTGSAQSPAWNSYNPNTLTLGGVTTGTDAGTYEATFTPKENYTWSDGSKDPKTVQWKIERAAIAITPTQSGSLTYTGRAQSPTWNGYDAGKMSIGGETSATDAGEHTATFTPGKNYRWSDGNTGAKSVVWRIGRATIDAVPTQNGSLTYTGNSQSPKWNGYDPAKMTLGGTSSGTGAGSYNASFTPTSNYQWNDGSTGAKSVAWSIGKAAGSLSLNKSSLSLNDSTRSGTVVATRPGTGAISATSSNNGIATVSVSGNNINVTGVSAGSVTITVRVAADDNYTAPAEKTFSVAVEFPQVFGVSWAKGSSTALSRLSKSNDPNGLVTVNITSEPKAAVGTGSGSSPFDAYAPWKDMEEYNIVNNAVGAKRGAGGFSRTNNDTVVFIPEFWFKIVETGGKMCYYISNKAKSGFTKHPGSGKYVGRYKTINGHFSKSGAAPLVNQTRAQFRTGARNKGSKWSQHDYASWCAVWLLYLVEFADWNSQAKIGRGYVDSNNGALASGGTDSMTYHTGRASGTDGKTAVQYRHIENPWGNVFEWIDGVNFDGGTVYMCTDRTKYADDTANGYTNIGTKSQSDGWIKSIGIPSAAPWAFFPTATGGSETTYIPDYAWSSGGWRVLQVGGYWNDGSQAGLFYFYASSDSGYSSSSIGARLLFHP